MTVPRTRRYPRRPIVKAQPKPGYSVGDRGPELVNVPDGSMVATALAATYGMRAAHAWTTNLAPTEQNNGVYLSIEGPSGGHVGFDATRASMWIERP